MKKYLIFFAYLVTSNMAFCQSTSVGIGTSQPNAGAALELKSVDKTLLLPRLNTASLSAVTTPAAGMIAYNVTTEKLVTFVNGPGINVLGQFGLSNSDPINSTISAGQSFVAPASVRLKEIGVYLVTQNVANTFTMYLYNGVGFSGSIIDSAKVSTVGVSGGNRVFSFVASDVSLQAGNYYSFQVASSAPSAATSSIGLAAGNPYANGIYYHGGQPDPDYDLYFYINSLTGQGTWHSLAVAPGNINMLAVAYGNVYSNATIEINNSSGNCVLNHIGPGVYEISFTGSNLSSIDLGNLAVNVSLYGATPGFITYTGLAGKIIVRTFNTTGTATDRGFGFSVFQP